MIHLNENIKCLPQFVFTLSPHVFHFTADLTCQVHVFLQQLMCVHGLELCVLFQRISRALTPILPPSPLTYVSIFPFLFLLSAKYAQHSQVQPFSVPNTLLKSPTMVAQT